MKGFGLPLEIQIIVTTLKATGYDGDRVSGKKRKSGIRQGRLASSLE